MICRIPEPVGESSKILDIIHCRTQPHSGTIFTVTEPWTPERSTLGAPYSLGKSGVSSSLFAYHIYKTLWAQYLSGNDELHAFLKVQTLGDSERIMSQTMR